MDINIQSLNFSNYFFQIFTPILFSIFDIISGYIQAIINKEVDSQVMREGLLHKILLIIIIIISCVIDITFKLPAVPKVVSIYIIIMELTSILENLDKSGLNIGKISNILKRKE